MGAGSRGWGRQDASPSVRAGRLQDLPSPRREAHVVAGEDNRSDGCAGAQTLQGRVVGTSPVKPS